MKSEMNIKVKNRLLFVGLILFVTLSLFLAPAGMAKADGPVLPHLLWGKVTTTGGSPAVGVQVTAWINGVPASNTLTTDATGQYGTDPLVGLPNYVVVTGNDGNILMMKVSGVTAQITRVGTLIETEPRHWEWQIKNPPLQSIIFNAGQVNGADLVYEPPIVQDTTPPAAVTDLATSAPTNNSITLTWTAPGDDGITGTASMYDIRYRTGGAVADANWDSGTTQATGEPTPLPAGSTQTFTVTVPSSGTTYYFALKTADEISNWSGLSNSPSGTTTTGQQSDTTAPAAVTDLATSAPTNNSIKLMWTAPGDDGITGTATSYDIRYRTGGAVTDDNWNSAIQATGEPSPHVAGTTENFVVNGLLSGTTYYFALKTADEASNLSGISNSPSGTTTGQPDITAPAAVSNLSTSAPTNISIKLMWTAPGDDGITGTATSYDIRYRTGGAVTDDNWNSAIQATGEPSPHVAGTTENFVVNGLSSSTTYYFALKTADEASNLSGISNSPSGTTLAPAAGGGGGGGGGGGLSVPSTPTPTTTPVPILTPTPTPTATPTPPVSTLTPTPTATPTPPVSTLTPTPTTTPPAIGQTPTPTPKPTPLPAEFNLANLLISKSRVAPGETVIISVDLSNTGEASGTYNTQLVINGETEATRSVELSGKESRTLTFSVTEDETGTYTVEINGLKGTFMVVGAVQWVLIAEIIGGIFVLAIIIFVIWRKIIVSNM